MKSITSARDNAFTAIYSSMAYASVGESSRPAMESAASLAQNIMENTKYHTIDGIRWPEERIKELMELGLHTEWFFQKKWKND
jgi:hypothetical protein